MPKFRNGGAGTPAIMSEPTLPAAPVEDIGGEKGARAVPLPAKIATADPAKGEGVDAKKTRAKKAAVSPPKDA